MRPASIALAVASAILLSSVPSALADDPWNSGRYQLGGGNNSHQATQYGATIGSGAPSAAQPPSPLDRAQNSVVGTTGTVRDGVEAGIKQANQTGGQIVNGTATAGRDLGQQFQTTTGLGSPPASSPTTWPAPPPTLSSAASARAATAPSSSGWTSIHSEMAPPTLLAPPLAPLSGSPSGNLSAAGAGPSFPFSPAPGTTNSASSNVQRDHSLLADPANSSRQNSGQTPSAASSAAKSPDWSAGWGTNTPGQPTLGSANDTAFGRNGESASTLPRVAPEVPRSSTSGLNNDTDLWNRPFPAAASSSNAAGGNPLRNSTSSAAAEDRYNPPPTSTQNGASIWAGLPAPSTTSASAPPINSSNQPGLSNQPLTGLGNFANQPGTAQNFGGQPMLNQPNLTQSGGNMSTLGFGNQNGLMGQQPMNQEQLPWMPLLAVSLTLAGSLGANLYLGWSYADARHRYHLLVRRSTESFHKATGIAA